jgi:hypothetical protein
MGCPTEEYVSRIAKIRKEVEGTEILENSFAIPEQPGRYLVIERTMGDRVWAMSCDTLEACAEAIDGSDTERDDLFILDLDKLGVNKGEHSVLTPVLGVVKIIGGEKEWSPCTQI